MKLSQTAFFALLATIATALDLDVFDRESITSVAKTITNSILSRYDGSIPGLFPPPYYFWEAGLTWDSLINYWHLTGDDTHNNLVHQALMFQLGSDNDYMPANQTKSLGNDDQSFWALAAMTAAETGFRAPDGNDSWAGIAQRVFDEQTARWDRESCGGGLRWQIFAFNPGYDYKNSISTGNFFQLGARLAAFTGNDTIYEWARQARNWTATAGLIDNGRSNRTRAGLVYDGASTTMNCSDINRILWSENFGTFISGSAYMYNISTTIENMSYPTQLFLQANDTFTNTDNGATANNTLTEVSCAPTSSCNTDQQAFRAILARSFAQMRALTSDEQFYGNLHNGSDINGFRRANLSDPQPSLFERIDLVLRTSAQGAAATCEEDAGCGSTWNVEGEVGERGLGQDLSALNVVLALLPMGKLADVNSTGNGAGTVGGVIGPDINDTATATGTGAGDNASGTGTGTGGLPSSTGAAAGFESAGSFAVLAGLGAAFAFFL